MPVLDLCLIKALRNLDVMSKNDWACRRRSAKLAVTSMPWVHHVSLPYSMEETATLKNAILAIMFICGELMHALKKCYVALVSCSGTARGSSLLVQNPNWAHARRPSLAALCTSH